MQIPGSRFPLKKNSRRSALALLVAAGALLFFSGPAALAADTTGGEQGELLKTLKEGWKQPAKPPRGFAVFTFDPINTNPDKRYVLYNTSQDAKFDAAAKALLKKVGESKRWPITQTYNWMVTLSVVFSVKYDGSLSDLKISKPADVPSANEEALLAVKTVGKCHHCRSIPRTALISNSPSTTTSKRARLLALHLSIAITDASELIT